MKRRMDSLLQSLVLIRFGQELGTDSDLAHGIASAIDFLIGFLSRFF
jgi:hypothetical protein